MTRRRWPVAYMPLGTARTSCARRSPKRRSTALFLQEPPPADVMSRPVSPKRRSLIEGRGRLTSIANDVCGVGWPRRSPAEATPRPRARSRTQDPARVWCRTPRSSCRSWPKSTSSPMRRGRSRMHGPRALPYTVLRFDAEQARGDLSALPPAQAMMLRRREGSASRRPGGRAARAGG